MIQQLVLRRATRLAGGPPTPAQLDAERQAVLAADPFDLALHLDQVWRAFAGGPAGARGTLIATGQFILDAPAANAREWDHYGYAFAIESTRVVQIIRRVVREYRSGESLGIPSAATQQWLDATEMLVYGAINPIGAWVSTSSVRSDPEAVRRNAYWRLFGMDLAFGTDDNRPVPYEKTQAANTSFVVLFEELLYELWQAIINLRNEAGVNTQDDDRIYRLAEQLGFIMRSRRQSNQLAREELSAATALGWLDLTLSTNSSVVVDLRADATSAGDRLKIIGERVGLAPHSRAASFFSMSSELSVLLRVIEGGFVSGPQEAWVLYENSVPAGATNPLGPTANPIGPESRRVITEWAAASGKDLKTRAKPVQVASTTNGRQPVSVR